MKLRDLTFIQIQRLANSGDLDVAQFGNRVIRLLGLSTKPTATTTAEYKDMSNLIAVLNDGLTNPVFSAKLAAVIMD